jgi:hypothetical protein
MKEEGQRLRRAVLPFIALLGLGACGRSGSNEVITPSPTPSIQQQRAARAEQVPQPVQERWDYLNRMRQSDAYSGIDRTRVDKENQLGVVLAANLTPSQVESTMKKAMESLARKFPNADMTLDAYAPSEPLRKLGTARFNAQSGQVAYAPVTGPGS